MSTPRKTWQKPVISFHKLGHLNKFGNTPRLNIAEDYEGVPISQLLKEYGSPLFVISEKRLRENVRRLRRTFSTRYPAVQIGWSYKTNYLNAVCAIMHQEGSCAEVVSGFEYEIAKNLGVPGNEIIFNGPYKQRPILEKAVEDGAQIHIDNFDEMCLLEEIAREKGKKVDVAIRLNFDTGYAEPWSRFGFNLENGQALDAAKRISSSGVLRLKGLHCHLGTFILDPRAYTVQVKKMAEFMDAAEQATGCIIEYIDIGGGFASMNSLQGQYLPPDQTVPTLEKYAEAITPALLEATKTRESKGRPRPTLILETGRALVDDAEILISSVIANKRMPDGKAAVIVDAGINVMFTGLWYNHDVRTTRVLDSSQEDTVVYGPLCMNIDVMRFSVSLPPLQVGEPLVFYHVGAYNNTQWLQFIGYRPPIVMVCEDGRVELIRKAESFDSTKCMEFLPEHLKLTHYSEPEQKK